MAQCVVCGKSFQASRSDAQTCSVKCRSKLMRDRKKARVEVERTTLDLWQQRDVTELENAVPAAGLLVKQIYAKYGKEAAIWAIDAIKLTCDYVAANK